MMNFIMITADPVLAKVAERAGANRIMVDLEQMGKFERQKCRDTWISKHQLKDIAPIADALESAELMVRINPLHSGSKNEIDEAIASGAHLIMLPMFTTMEEIRECADLISGRCGFIPLIETGKAISICGDVASEDSVTEVFIGLNDLHLSLGLDFMFEPLTSGLLDTACAKLAKIGKPYGFGGVARVGEGDLPAVMIIQEHARLGSSRVILSRTFARNDGMEDITADTQLLQREINKLATVYRSALDISEAAHIRDHALVASRIDEIVAKQRSVRAATK